MEDPFKQNNTADNKPAQVVGFQDPEEKPTSISAQSISAQSANLVQPSTEKSNSDLIIQPTIADDNFIVVDLPKTPTELPQTSIQILDTPNPAPAEASHVSNTPSFE